MIGKSLALTAFGAVGVSAFWRMECRGELGLARMDPIMNPGEVSTHAHSIFGSSGFSESATFDTLRNGDCTSCAVTEDMSAYWTPALYFKHANGDFEAVSNVGGMLAYYLPRDPKNDVKGFPEGFRMIAGTNFRRNYTVGDPSQPDPGTSEWASLGQTTQDDLVQRSIGFNCLNYQKAAEGSLYRHYLPDKDYLDANCLNGTRFEIVFPSCWNGKDVDSEDHQSHMAYPDLVQDGQCPDNYPVRLVTLFYETIWDTYAFAGQDGEFIIANGDPTGYGYHGDFVMGWDPDFLQEAVDTCTNLSGMIEDCPLFSILDEATQNTCKIDLPSALAKENVLGGSKNLMKALPGNVEIQYGPESATPPSGGAATSAVTSAQPTSSASRSAPSLSYSSGPSSTPGMVMIATSSISSDFAAAAVPTPAPTSTAPEVSYLAYTTQTVDSASGIEEIVWEEAVVFVTEETVTTTTVYPESSSPAKRDRQARAAHWARHQHHGHGRR